MPVSAREKLVGVCHSIFVLKYGRDTGCVRHKEDQNKLVKHSTTSASCDMTDD
jgi:hypothetical protein